MGSEEFLTMPIYKEPKITSQGGGPNPESTVPASQSAELTLHRETGPEAQGAPLRESAAASGSL
jgi:hypothetical protein